MLPWIPTRRGRDSFTLTRTITSEELKVGKSASCEERPLQHTDIHRQLHVVENAKAEKIHFHFDELDVDFAKCLRVHQFLPINHPIVSSYGSHFSRNNRGSMLSFSMPATKPRFAVRIHLQSGRAHRHVIDHSVIAHPQSFCISPSLQRICRDHEPGVKQKTSTILS